MAEKGLWVAIDGVDAVGKSTQVSAVSNRLRRKGISPVTQIAEFSSFPPGQIISAILARQRFYALDPQKRTPLADTAFLASDMMAQYETQIDPTITQGGIAVSDRGNISFIAYQALRVQEQSKVVNQQNAFEWVNNLAKQCLIAPDVTILLTLPEQEMIRRIVARGEEAPSEQDLDFLRRTNKAIKKAIKVSGSKVVEIDGALPKEEITEKIVAEIDRVTRRK